MQESDKIRILFILYPKRWVEYPYNDHSCRYRCFNPAADLKKMGYIADICVYKDFRKEYVDWYDAFIFHRPQYSRELKSLISLMGRKRKIYLADYDDLVFDPKNALTSSLYRSGRASRKIIIDIYEKNLASLRLFPYVTASTEPLKDEVLISHPSAEVKVIYNGLAKQWIDAADSNDFDWSTSAKKIITYLPGTDLHDNEFAAVSDILAEYLRSHRDVHLHIVGPLKFNAEIFPSRQLAVAPAVPYDKLQKIITKSWVTIAPLHENSFNKCKSGLKFFESASLGIPVIASPIPDMVRFQGSGIFLADNKEEWHAALDSLKDPYIYRQISQKIKQFATKNCTSEKQTQKLAAFLETEAGRMVPVRSDKGVRHQKIYPAHFVNVNSEKTKRHRLNRKFNKLLKDPCRFLSDSRHKSLRGIASLLT